MEFKFPARVYYEDTDVAGVVYHANYLKYMERGRTELLRHLGIEQDRFIEDDIAFAVRRMDIDFLKPARFNDKLTITTRVKLIKKASILFEQEVVLVDDALTQLCQAQVQVACVQMTSMRPKPIPQQILEELQRA